MIYIILYSVQQKYLSLILLVPFFRRGLGTRTNADARSCDPRWSCSRESLCSLVKYCKKSIDVSFHWLTLTESVDTVAELLCSW